jgi:putative FmdB family regulatory protein
MPVYVYGLAPGAGASGCPRCRAGFEAAQRMSDPPLAKCPECGAPVERRPQPVNALNADWIKGPSAKRMAAAGFTQYKRTEKGYERTFGGGPKTLRP